MKYVIKSLTKNANPTSGIANIINPISRIVVINLPILWTNNHQFAMLPVHLIDDIITNAPSANAKNNGIRI